MMEQNDTILSPLSRALDRVTLAVLRVGEAETMLTQAAPDGIRSGIVSTGLANVRQAVAAMQEARSAAADVPLRNDKHADASHNKSWRVSRTDTMGTGWVLVLDGKSEAVPTEEQIKAGLLGAADFYIGRLGGPLRPPLFKGPCVQRQGAEWLYWGRSSIRYSFPINPEDPTGPVLESIIPVVPRLTTGGDLNLEIRFLGPKTTNLGTAETVLNNFLTYNALSQWSILRNDHSYPQFPQEAVLHYGVRLPRKGKGPIEPYLENRSMDGGGEPVSN